MNDDHIDRIKKILSWIIFLSFFGIIFTSLIPWISVSETYPVEGDLFFNLDMMKKSNDKNIITLSETVEQISLCFFLLFCFCILSYLGLILYRSNKAKSISQIIIIIGGCAFVVLSIAIVRFNYYFIKIVQDLENVSLPEILGPIKFAYLPLIVGIISLVLSIIFTWIIVTFSLQFSREKTGKNIKSKDEQINKKTSDTEAVILFDESSKKDKPKGAQAEEHKDIENWLKDEVENIDRDTKKFDQEFTNIPVDKKEEMKNDIDEPEPRGKIDKKPLAKNEEITEEPQIQDEIEKYSFFEPDVRQEEDNFIDDLEKPEIQNNTETELKEEEPLKRVDDINFEKKIYKKPLVKNEDITEEQSIIKEESPPLQENESEIQEEIIEEEIKPEINDENTQKSKPVVSPFKSKEKTEETVIPDDPGTAISFDNILSSVIDKRQGERKKKPLEEEPDEDKLDEEEIEEDDTDVDEGKVIITVRCPECKQIFKVEKTGEITEIKCPKCGKEGIVK